MANWKSKAAHGSLQEVSSLRAQDGQPTGDLGPICSNWGGVSANGCPRGIMGNSGDSIPTTVIMPPGVGNAFQCQWEPRPGCQNPHAMLLEIRRHHQTIGHTTRNPPSHHNFICGTAVRNALSRCLAPVDLYCPAGRAVSPSLTTHHIHTLLSVTPCPWRLPLGGKMGVGGRWRVL